MCSGNVPASKCSATTGRKLLAHVLAHRVPDQPLLVVELGVEVQRIAGIELGQGGGGGGHALQRTTQVNV